MTPEEYSALLEYIQENNSWERMYLREADTKKPLVKYVTSHYDTRTGKIHDIVLRISGSIVFTINNEYDIEKIYKFLRGEG